ncbi:MAG: YidC/Oxa1 family rane protein insertase [Actinomycetota bacterium]|nr:YidC/Oxa1 family rane protein insertase [Actinomycetota bacterium]
MNGLIAAIATPVATVLRAIHAFLSTFLAPSSGPAWALSIVLLTICVRLLLFPLFVKQIKSQRRMQELAPKIKELQTRHKGDRETLNTELMKLYKDNNANPISGCLPLILQLPVFFALFSVINEFRPGKSAKFGLSAEQLAEGGRAKVFGAPIAASFNSGQGLLTKLDGNITTVRVVAAIMIVLMGATTFWTQRQMMARAGTAVDKQQQQIQKFMLYVLPLSFAVFGVNFPIGVLLYWLTTNIWSMGQQAWVIKRMPPVVPGSSGGGGKGGGPSGDRKGPPGGGGPGKPGKASKPPEQPEQPEGTEASTVGEVLATTTAGSVRPPANRPGDKRSAGSRKNKKRGKR